MQPQPGVNEGLPRIDARTVGLIKIRLQALSGQQFGVRYQEIQLKTALVTVLHPQNAVLVFIKTGHQNPLEALHHLLTLAGRQIRLRE